MKSKLALFLIRIDIILMIKKKNVPFFSHGFSQENLQYVLVQLLFANDLKKKKTILTQIINLF